MKKYHVTYFYLATGMEGYADTKDHGYWEANSEQEAIEACGKSLYPNSDKLTQTWGLSASPVSSSSTINLSHINELDGI